MYHRELPVLRIYHPKPAQLHHFSTSSEPAHRSVLRAVKNSITVRDRTAGGRGLTIWPIQTQTELQQPAHSARDSQRAPQPTTDPLHQAARYVAARVGTRDEAPRCHLRAAVPPGIRRTQTRRRPRPRPRKWWRGTARADRIGSAAGGERLAGTGGRRESENY